MPQTTTKTTKKVSKRKKSETKVEQPPTPPEVEEVLEAPDDKAYEEGLDAIKRRAHEKREAERLKRLRGLSEEDAINLVRMNEEDRDEEDFQSMVEGSSALEKPETVDASALDCGDAIGHSLKLCAPFQITIREVTRNFENTVYTVVMQRKDTRQIAKCSIAKDDWLTEKANNPRDLGKWMRRLVSGSFGLPLDT